MNTTDNTSTDLALDTLKRALQQVHAPASLEPQLTAAFRAKHPARSKAATRRRMWWMPPLAMAATLAMLSWMVRGPLSVPVAGSALVEAADPGPFLALRPIERIALEPQATVVTTEFPRALLANWGLPVSPERAGEPVRAEMLLSSTGETLAVRVID